MVVVVFGWGLGRLILSLSFFKLPNGVQEPSHARKAFPARPARVPAPRLALGSRNRAEPSRARNAFLARVDWLGCLPHRARLLICTAAAHNCQTGSRNRATHGPPRGPDVTRNSGGMDSPPGAANTSCTALGRNPRRVRHPPQGHCGRHQPDAQCGTAVPGLADACGHLVSQRRWQVEVLMAGVRLPGAHLNRHCCCT